jgi:hypothetical protein
MTSPMVQALDAFGSAMAEAEKHRKILRQKFGLSDHQIGTLTLSRRPKRTMMNDYAAAVLAAKQKLGNRS